MIRWAKGREPDERGAALVEFALVFPIFMMLVLAMFTGGQAYDTKLSITEAARDAARAGATMTVTTTVDALLDEVATIAVASASGELDTVDSGRRLCVAFVNGAVARRRVETTAGSLVREDLPCFTDNLPVSQRRVQVEARRTERLQALVFSQELTLDARGISRHEAPAP